MTQTAPGYWMNETSGVLRPAVEAYLRGGMMTDQHIAAMRAYLWQWMQGDWQGSAVPLLRWLVCCISTRQNLSEWLELAQGAGIDPL